MLRFPSRDFDRQLTAQDFLVNSLGRPCSDALKHWEELWTIRVKAIRIDNQQMWSSTQTGPEPAIEFDSDRSFTLSVASMSVVQGPPPACQISFVQFMEIAWGRSEMNGICSSCVWIVDTRLSFLVWTINPTVLYQWWSATPIRRKEGRKEGDVTNFTKHSTAVVPVGWVMLKVGVGGAVTNSTTI